MDIREPGFFHPKPGPAKPLLPVRAAENPYTRKAIPIREQAPSRVPEFSPPQRQAVAVSRQVESPPRCREKGCVFPADHGEVGICRQHRREQREPVFFSSLQVTGLLLDAAKLGLPNSTRDLARQQDRRRLETIRQRFLEELV